MKCRECDANMNPVEIRSVLGSSFVAVLENKWGTKHESGIDTYGCPECGKIDMRLQSPKVPKVI